LIRRPGLLTLGKLHVGLEVDRTLRTKENVKQTKRRREVPSSERRLSMEEFIAKLPEYLISYGLRIIAAVVIFLIGRWVARMVSRLAEKLLVRANVDAALAKFLRSICYFLILAFVIIAAIDKTGIQTTSLVAIIGAAGLAIGFALQGSLSNFAAGVMILIFKPFKTGDFVEVAGTLGSVQDVRVFNTILNHPDNRRIIIPNAQITADKITNFTAIDKRRVDMTFGISYEDDMKKAKDTLMALLTSDPRVLKDPEPVVAVGALGDSSVNLVVRPWVKPDDYWGVLFDTMEKGKTELEKAGLSIPFPQRDVHLFQESKAA
jgi:small conductance mechanosensitive channel